MTSGPGQKRRLSMTTESRILSLDRLKGLLKQEETYCIGSNYIPDEYSDEVVETYAKWRYKMVEWLQEILDMFQYQPETLEVGMSILDRYVAARPYLMEDSREYKMAALTSLYIAAKMYETVCMTPEHVYDLSFEINLAERTIEEEELDILHCIGWKVNPPTPTVFAHELFALIPSDLIPKEEISEIVQVQLEQILREEVFVTERTSMLVLAAMCNAITSFLNSEYLPKFIELRLFSALGIAHDGQAAESVDRLRELISTISILRGNQYKEQEFFDSLLDDEEEENLPPPPKDDDIASYSPRSIVPSKSIC